MENALTFAYNFIAAAIVDKFLDNLILFKNVEKSFLLRS